MPGRRNRQWRSGRYRASRIPALAIALSVLMVSFLVTAVSRAAFTDTTANSVNSLTAGTIDLIDDDSGSAMFSVADMVPGDTSQKCVTVTYQGTVANPAGIKVYSGGYVDSGNFDTYLNLTIEEGSGGSFASCVGFTLENTIESTGTLSDFDTTHTNYATGAGVWDPASTPVSKTYRITFELDGATPDAEQAESVTALVFTWEVQS